MPAPSCFAVDRKLNVKQIATKNYLISGVAVCFEVEVGRGNNAASLRINPIALLKHVDLLTVATHRQADVSRATPPYMTP